MTVDAKKYLLIAAIMNLFAMPLAFSSDYKLECSFSGTQYNFFGRFSGKGKLVAGTPKYLECGANGCRSVISDRVGNYVGQLRFFVERVGNFDRLVLLIDSNRGTTIGKQEIKVPNLYEYLSAEQEIELSYDGEANVKCSISD